MVTPQAEYLRLGATAQERREVYVSQFGSFADERIEEIRAATNGGYVLGNERFRSTMAKALGRRVEKGKAGRPSTGVAADDAQQALCLPARKNVVCP